MTSSTRNMTTVKQGRLRHGLTLTQLAEKCAEKGATITIGQLSRIERGIYRPRPRLALVLAELLNLDPVTDFVDAVVARQEMDGAA